MESFISTEIMIISLFKPEIGLQHVECRWSGHHKGPADRVSTAKIFPQPSEQIFLSTLDTAYQIALGSPVPGPILACVAGLLEIVMQHLL
jgi:hypothetical protein